MPLDLLLDVLVIRGSGCGMHESLRGGLWFFLPKAQSDPSNLIARQSSWTKLRHQRGWTPHISSAIVLPTLICLQHSLFPLARFLPSYLTRLISLRTVSKFFHSLLFTCRLYCPSFYSAFDLCRLGHDLPEIVQDYSQTSLPVSLERSLEPFSSSIPSLIECRR
jgi:hypothetical protein